MNLKWTIGLVMVLAAGCKADKEEDSADAACADYPSEPREVNRTLSNVDTCGYWWLSVGEHIYINVAVSTEDDDCAASVGTGLIVPYTPTYSNMGTDGPKWTFDIEAQSETDGQPATVEVTCDDKTTWHARVDVVAP